MANKYKKRKKTINKTKGWITDYYRTGRDWDKDNRRRREEAGEKEHKGLKHLSAFELACIVIIIIGLIGLFVKLVVLKHGFWTPGL